MEPQTQDTQTDEMLDLPVEFRSVAKQHGKELFQLVVNCGLAGQALERLAQGTEEVEALEALMVITKCFNLLSAAYAKKQDWSDGQLAHCDRDIRLAFAGKIIVPGQRLVLDA